MRSSFDVLQSAQIARIQSAPLSAATPGTALQESYLEGMRQRNVILDWMCYDVRRITKAEARSLSPWLAAEGAILYVPPSGGGSWHAAETKRQRGAKPQPGGIAIPLGGVPGIEASRAGRSPLNGGIEASSPQV